MTNQTSSKTPTFDSAASQLSLVAKKLNPVVSVVVEVGKKALEGIVDANKAVAAQVSAGKNIRFVDESEKALAVANTKAIDGISEHLSGLSNKFFINLGGDIIQDVGQLVENVTTRLAEGIDGFSEGGISTAVAAVAHGSDEQRLDGIKEEMAQYNQQLVELVNAPGPKTGEFIRQRDELIKKITELSHEMRNYQAAVDMLREVEKERIKEDVGVNKESATSQDTKAGNVLDENGTLNILSDSFKDLIKIEDDGNKLLTELISKFDDVASICSCDEKVVEGNLVSPPIIDPVLQGQKTDVNDVKQQATAINTSMVGTDKIPEKTNSEVDESIGKLSKLGEVSKQIFGDLSTAVDGWKHRFVDSLLAGKESFKSFVSSILKQLAKLALKKAVFSILDAIGGKLFPDFFGSGKASGGPVLGGRPYIVGEQGPELFLPSSGGKIIPNHRLNGSGRGGNVIEVNANVNINGGNVDRNGFDQQTAGAIQRQFENMARQAFQLQLRQEMRPGGMLAVGI